MSQKRSVGVVSLQYDGASADEAFQKMTAKLGLAVPGSTCAGWDWKAPIDDNHIRALIEH